MAKQSYADKLRDKLINKAEEDLANRQGSGLEWSPDFGTYKIRILPPLDPEQLFYHTHSFHWIPADISEIGTTNGRFLWTRKEYEVNGKKVRDPIDVAVKQFYSTGRAEDDPQLKKMGGVLKRKRHFFTNIILFNDDGPEFKILVDKTNEGKLMRIICATMGIPFWRDVEDNWIVKESTEIDPDKEYYDLLDPEVGHDFKIVKKKTGSNAWDISFEDSFPISKPRALSEEEKELMNERVDLVTYKEYEEDYNTVKNILNSLLEGESVEDNVKTHKENDDDDDDDDAKTTNVEANVNAKKNKKTSSITDEQAIEDLVNQIDDE